MKKFLNKGQVIAAAFAAVSTAAANAGTGGVIDTNTRLGDLKTVMETTVQKSERPDALILYRGADMAQPGSTVHAGHSSHASHGSHGSHSSHSSSSY